MILMMPTSYREKLESEYKQMVAENTENMKQHGNDGSHMDTDVIRLTQYKWYDLLGVKQCNVKIPRSDGTVSDGNIENYEYSSYVPPYYIRHPFVLVDAYEFRKYVSLKCICELNGIDYSSVMSRLEWLRGYLENCNRNRHQ